MKKQMKRMVCFALIVAVVCAAALPVLAGDAPAPTEISPNGSGIIDVSGNRIISQPNEVQATTLRVERGGTLTIAENVTVEVGSDRDSNHNNGTIIVYGTLDLRGAASEDCDHNEGTIIVYGTLIVSKERDVLRNNGTIIVYGTLVSGEDGWLGKLYNDGGEIILAKCCGGKIIGELASVWDSPEHVDHYYYNGVCGCGAVDPDAVDPDASTLSEGNWWIVIVAAVVVAAVVVLVVMKKKKKV